MCCFFYNCRNCHEREIQLAMSEEEKLKKYMLEVYQVLRDPEKVNYSSSCDCCCFLLIVCCGREQIVCIGQYCCCLHGGL